MPFEGESVCESHLIGAIVPCGRRHATAATGCGGVTPLPSVDSSPVGCAENHKNNNNNIKGSAYYYGDYVDGRCVGIEEDSPHTNADDAAGRSHHHFDSIIMHGGKNPLLEDDAVKTPHQGRSYIAVTGDDLPPPTATTPSTSSFTTVSPEVRCDSWSSTRAIVRGAFKGVKILPTTATTRRNSRKHHRHHHRPTSTILAPSASAASSSSKALFFSSDAFEEGSEDEEDGGSLTNNNNNNHMCSNTSTSTAATVATGIATCSDCSFLYINDDYGSSGNDGSVSGERGEASLVYDSPPQPLPTPVVFVKRTPPVPPTPVCFDDVPEGYDDEEPLLDHHLPVVLVSPLTGIPRHADTPGPSSPSPTPPSPTPPPYQLPSSPVTSTTSKTGRMPLIPPFGTPLLPADPTNKYTKIMQKYGFTVVHHVCLTTLYQDHQRYVSALAKANPTLVPSPFPFIKELTAQQQAVAMHAAT